jgi:hypothetical protein
MNNDKKCTKTIWRVIMPNFFDMNDENRRLKIQNRMNSSYQAAMSFLNKEAQVPPKDFEEILDKGYNLLNLSNNQFTKRVRDESKQRQKIGNIFVYLAKYENVSKEEIALYYTTVKELMHYSRAVASPPGASFVALAIAAFLRFIHGEWNRHHATEVAHAVGTHIQGTHADSRLCTGDDLNKFLNGLNERHGGSISIIKQLYNNKLGGSAVAPQSDNIRPE